MKELKKGNRVTEAILKKLLKTQESIKQNENELFVQYPFYGNLRTVLYLHLDQHDMDGEEDIEIDDINSEILERFPGNITAKLNQFYISVADEDLDIAEEVVNSLEQKYDIHEERYDIMIEVLSARIDLAYLYHQLEPKLYYQAVNHYEACLAQAEELVTECDRKIKGSDVVQRIKKDTHVWQYYLLVTYNRMLNSDFLCIQEDSAKRVRTTETCFSQICRLGQALLQTADCLSLVILSRTLVDMYDAHFKMKFESNDKTCHCIMCTMLSQLPLQDQQVFKSSRLNSENIVDSFLSVALELTPNDGHILEKIGRLKRITAQSEKHLHEAKNMLEKCVRLYPTRHVSWHQLGRTYRSLWLYPQHKEFYCNPVRKGHQKKKKKSKLKRNDDLFSEVAAEVVKLRLKEDMVEQAENSALKFANGASVSAVQGHVPNEQSEAGKIDKSPVLPQTVALKSRNPERDGLPQHRRKVDWFDRFRTENPPASEKDAPEYLKKALDCLKNANDVVNGTLCQILVDLGRLHISLQNFKQAERFFNKAKKCTTATLHDKAYLYEQWGLFAQLNLNQLEKAKSLYRHAVEYSVKSFTKSKIAFYNLKDILQKQLSAIEANAGCEKEESITQTEQSRVQEKLSLEKEYALLQKLVANFKEAKDMLCDIMSRENWRGQKELRNLAWDLVDIFASTKCYEDAWCYINSNLIYTAEKKHQWLILEVSFGLAKQLHVMEEEATTDAGDDQEISQNMDVLSVVFEYLTHPALKRTASEGTAPFQKIMESPPAVSRSLSECYIYPVQACDVLLVCDDIDDEPPGYVAVRKILSQCRLLVRGEEDILPGANRLTAYCQVAQWAKMVLVFSDDITSASKRQLYNIAQSIVNEITIGGMCRHVVCLHSRTKQVCDLYRHANVTGINITDFLALDEAQGSSSASQKYAFVRKLFELLCDE